MFVSCKCKQNRQNIHRIVSHGVCDSIARAHGVSREQSRAPTVALSSHPLWVNSFIVAFFACVAITFQQQQIVWHIFFPPSFIPLSLLLLLFLFVWFYFVFLLPIWCAVSACRNKNPVHLKFLFDVVINVLHATITRSFFLSLFLSRLLFVSHKIVLFRLFFSSALFFSLSLVAAHCVNYKLNFKEKLVSISLWFLFFVVVYTNRSAD